MPTVDSALLESQRIRITIVLSGCATVGSGLRSSPLVMISAGDVLENHEQVFEVLGSKMVWTRMLNPSMKS